MWSTPFYPLHPGLLVRVPFMGQIELFNHLTVSERITEERNCLISN